MRSARTLRRREPRPDVLVRIGLSLVWLLHFLPFGVLRRLGELFGLALFAFGRERRRVARINLGLCFPELDTYAKRRLLRRHFMAFGRSVLERGIVWWGSRESVRRRVQIEGIEHWQAVQDQPVIWLAPHFVGLDMGGVRLTADYRLVSIYSRQKNAQFDAILRHGRTRFEPTVLYSRQHGVLPVVRALKKGLPFYYLPDQDFGAKDALFVPFFGVPAATVTALPRIAKLAGAVIVPCVTRQTDSGYIMRFYPAWTDFPSGDLEHDTRRMNEFIEARVREMPEQYFWLHKRFKTRPPGEARFYQ